ncbi:uncharacterized protein LOC126894927 [Daktulosphaira vitifoliae]|uniref:uncharacterized protein LOC126894927 n=1 Tax=Daktulosphaira vitifoliae TaxID=58002 RepID=UPI0021AA0DC9|nr:uncharacterized protein LOC126894927 [Daktulosphaira vitifoliae]
MEKKKCESLGFTFIKHKIFISSSFQTYRVNDLYKVLSDLICGDRKFNMKLQKKICTSIKSNVDIKKLFRNEESFNDYLNHYIKFENSVLPYNKYGDNECPICCEEFDLPVILNKCHHSLCYECAESLININENKCPLCRENFSYYLDKEEGKDISPGDLIEFFAAAYYLDVCIFLYFKENEWMFFDKNGLNYSEEDMNSKKCIYLYINRYKYTMGVVTTLKDLSYIEQDRTGRNF